MDDKGEQPVKNPLTRREFLAGATAAGLGVSAALSAEGEKPDEGFKTKLHKALILGGANEKECDALKAAGFDGFECGAWSVKPEDAEAGRKIAEKAGLRIHSVLRGWTNFNDPKSLQADLASVETALKAAAGFGADAVLLVPCRTGVGGPQAWEFDYQFDPKTCHVTAVVKGDNAKWADYIKAQNEATDASKAAVEKLIPAAEKAGVVIALENVWNNLWCKPDLAAAFVRMFDSKWVRAYFDIGNHVKYAAPELWIAALGKLLAKCHVKDFKLKADGHGGDFVDIRDGSVNWPAVRKALDDVGYNGWMTIEGGGCSMKEHSARLDLIIAGK
jgi:hexulose-6-phosphate isomerase